MRLERTGEVFATADELAALGAVLEDKVRDSFGGLLLGMLGVLAGLPFAADWIAPAVWGALIGFHWGLTSFWQRMDRVEGRRPGRPFELFAPHHAWAIVLVALIADPVRGLIFGGGMLSALHGLLLVHSRWFLADLAAVFTVSPGLPRVARPVRVGRLVHSRPPAGPNPAAPVFELHELQMQEGAACRVCGDGFAHEALVACAGCETPHHRACWYYNGGCSVFACESKKGREVVRGEPAPILPESPSGVS